MWGQGLTLPPAFQPAIFLPAMWKTPPPPLHATVGAMKYPVALVRTEQGYSVSCPGLPGCWSQGATEEQALANIRDAIREYLDVAKQLAGVRNLREVEIPA